MVKLSRSVLNARSGIDLVASGRVRLKLTATHILTGIELVPLAFEITANKGKHQAINPAQVRMKAT